MFLEDMILYHTAAVEASKAALELSISKETAELANSIIATQIDDISLMKELLGLLPR